MRLGSRSSSSSTVSWGVPQGSILGPMLFLLYTADFPTVVRGHGLQSHNYGDDSQIYGHSSLSSVHHLPQRMCSCVDDVAHWMRSNRLQQNTAKTEVLWCITSRRQHQLPTSSVRVGTDHVLPSSLRATCAPT